MSGRRIAVLDIGGTKIKGCVFVDGKPGQKGETDSEAKQGALHLLEQASALLESFLPFDAVGISTAGQVDPNNGTIRYANDNVPGYTGTDVKGFFEGRFDVPAAVINDVYAAALGEGRNGAAQGEQDYLCLTYGTGIGGGVVLNGKLYYGAGASAGVMLGGIVLHPELFDPADPFAGTYERCASTTALRAAMEQVVPGLTGRGIFQRLEEPVVKAAVDAWLDQVAAGLCALIHAYNVPCVVLGGGVMEQPYAIEGTARRVYERLIPGFRGVKVVGAKLGNMAGLYGAYSLAERL
ncbi:ROK family protein [Anaerotruncus sp.]|jgi:predicted NBD/HSP70 family sugar kinase|uniref:ROK family protein n=1 Tax=Anaerotruncus TaxID=244127 RepID=UPI00216FBBBC|nr:MULTISPECIES: ROK family protein [Anaerotruncus]MCI8493483.1 ROK family protein [Anaerotruncus sp.]